MAECKCEDCNIAFFSKLKTRRFCDACLMKRRRAYMKGYNQTYNAMKKEQKEAQKKAEKEAELSREVPKKVSRKPQKPISELSRVAREAKEHGMDYGEYVARLKL